MGQIGFLFNLVFTFPIFNGLMLLYKLFGDFGLSIVVLTIIIKLLLFPLTLQQLKSTKAMQALQPQLAEIKKKYKEPAAQSAATQALYKEYSINPLAGCLPLFVQLPILYGLFNAFNNALRFTPTKSDTLLQHINSIIYPFLPHFTKVPNLNLTWFTFINPHWYIALSQPDPTHILPIIAGLATFVQLRMSQPKTVTKAAADDPTQQMTKTMQYIMPLVTVFFGWTFPSGLALYWTVSSIFQAIQQYFVTGWGGFSLVKAPTLVSRASVPTSQRDFTKEKNSVSFFGREFQLNGAAANGSSTGSVDSNVVEGSVANGDGPIGSQLRSSSTRRKPASARRRSSNNTQKRNTSRR